MHIRVTPKFFLEDPWRLEGWGITHVISIQESADYGKESKKYPTPPWVESYNHHRFYFDDVTNEYNHQLTAATMEDIVKIAECGRKLPEDSTVLVHCHAGVSRSPAVALGILAVRYGLEEGWKQWLKIPGNLNFWPNELVVQMFDDYLGSNNFLYDKVRQWKKDEKDRLAERGVKLLLPFDDE